MASLSTETITAMQSVFTPGPGCHKSWTYEGESYNYVEGGLLMQNLDAYDFASSCFPEDFGMYGRAPSSIQVYSPGGCPSGYATPGQFNNEGTTTGICCPSSYSYASTYSTIFYTDTTSVLFMGCISHFRGTTKVPARANDTDLTSTQITGHPVGYGDGITMWAQPITVEYQQKDLSLFGLTSSTAAPTGRTISNSASLPSATGTTTTTSASASSTASSSSSTSSLSTGAKAGIGIGVALGVLLLLAIGAFLMVKQRKNRSHRNVQDGKEPYRQPQWGRSEMDAAERERKIEMDASEPRRQRTVQEMEG